jgi:hypothetical protein
MRYQSFVQSVVVKTVAANFAKIDAFAGQVHGGWEGWLQLEIYYYAVTNKLNLGLFERESRIRRSKASRISRSTRRTPAT